MDATALSNALFVIPVTAVPKQFEVKPAAGDRLQPTYAEVEADSPAAAEGVVGVSEDYRGEEKVEFKETLNEESSEQQVDAPENVEGQGKSDNSIPEEAEKYASASSAAISSRLEELIAGVSTGQVQTANPASAVLGYLAVSQLGDNPGSASELGQVVETGGSDQGQAVVTAEGMVNEAQAKAAQGAASELQAEDSSGEVEASNLQQTVKTVEAVGKELAEQGVEQAEDKAVAGQSVVQAGQLQITNKAEGVDAEQVKGETAAVLNRETVAQVQTTDQNDSPAKGAEQQEQIEQMTDALSGQIKNSTDKGPSRDESDGSAILGQNNSSQAVSSTDTGVDAVEKSTEVSKTFEPEQPQSAKEPFDKVGEQLQASISNSVRQGESEVTVRLNPPELGRVLIRLQQQDGQITGVLEFSKAETRAEAQQLVPQLVRNLQDAGIAVKRLDLVQTQIDNSGQQQFREHVAQEGMAYQQQFSRGQPGNIGLGYDWVSGEPVYSGAELLSESFISDQGVNVLV